MAYRKERLKTIIQELFEANQELHFLLYRKRLKQVLGQPCTESELKRIETTTGFVLPPSYRQFLLLHNGWKKFSGNAHILSTSDRDNAGIIDRIENFKALQKEDNNFNAVNAFVVVAGDDSTYIVYLDVHTRRPSGEVDVVEYGYEEGEIDRYPDFVAYLEDQYQIKRELIDEEKGELHASNEA